MRPIHVPRCLIPLLALPLATAGENEGYLGYMFNQKGDPESAVYKTANTNTAPKYVLPEDPDVYLNATVNVDSIRVEVADLVAKVNLDAKVMDLLHFTAGVDASIERVSLRIDDVYARAELEARLGNVVRMVDDVLASIDINPIVAALGKNVVKVVGGVTDVVGNTAQGVLGGGIGGQPVSAGAGGAAPPPGGGSGPQNSAQPGSGDGDGAPKPPPRDEPNPSEPNILYSYTDPSTKTGFYTVLEQNGDISKVGRDAQGKEMYRSVVGWYVTDLEYMDRSEAIKSNNGKVVGRVYEYTFSPEKGVILYCYVYHDTAERVAGTEVLREPRGPGWEL